MSYNRILSSSRLLLKPIDLSYATDTYLGWLNDKEITKYLEIFSPYTLEDLTKYLLAAESNDQLLFWAIHIADTGKHIGNIKIDPINFYHGLGEYGILMGDKSEWGKGYAAEASKTVIDFCFEERQLRKINLGVVLNNKAAVRLYEKLGFEIEGVLKKHGIYNGEAVDVLRMAKFNPVIQSD